MICRQWAAVTSSIGRFFSVTMVRYTLEERVFLCDIYAKYGSARNCRPKFRRKFHDEKVASRQAIHNFVSKLRSTGFLIEKVYNNNPERKN
jgi:hypothetical protein